MGSENIWRGTSSGERADDRRDRLIVAALDIVSEQGAAALAVRAVCRAAAVSPRHFYESFPDTDALLLAAYERAVGQLLEAITGSVSTADDGSDLWPDLSPRDRLRHVFEAAAGYLDDHPQAGHIIFREALTNDVLRSRAVMTLPAFLKSARNIAVPDADSAPRAQLHLQSVVLSGGLASAFVEWLSGTDNFSREELVEYCTEATSKLLSLKLPRARG